MHSNMAGPVVVGVVPRQPAAVARAAATFAERFGVGLVCASVDTSRYTLAHALDGSDVAMPIDPDVLGPGPTSFDPELEASLASALEGCPVHWSVRALSGNPAQELTRLADSLGAPMIVVGTREAGLRGSLHEFFNGSVAVQLAHRQHRPVVVVPLAPVGADDEIFHGPA